MFVGARKLSISGFSGPTSLTYGTYVAQEINPG